MKVIIVGANGQIGRKVVKQLQESDQYSVVAVVRKQEQAIELQDNGIEAALVDLEGKVEQIIQTFTGADCIIFTAGSGGHTGPDKTLLIDLDGAVKCIEAAEAAGVERFLMVSAFDADKREKWSAEMRPYYVAKHYADRLLEQSSLNYTIIRPGGLTNDPPKKQITAGVEAAPSTISRDDVASVIVQAIDEPNTYQKTFNLVNGPLEIKEALQKL